LDPRKRNVLELRFGLDGQAPHTLEEIGEILHLTRERVRQIEERALAHMRHPLRSRKLRDYLA
jgi:RNA polymerase primary sigma factor